MKLIPYTNLFDYPGDCGVITTNTVGAMGAGIALEFKKRYPKAYYQYHRECRAGYHHVGFPQLIQTEDGRQWLLFPTKDNWRDPSRYEWLKQGLGYLIENIGEPGYVQHDWTLVFPALGCSNGQLEFTHVKAMMEVFDNHVPNEVILIAPPGYSN